MDGVDGVGDVDDAADRLGGGRRTLVPAPLPASPPAATRPGLDRARVLDEAVPLVATRHPDAPWLRPPLRSLELVECFLDGLVRRGFSDQAAVRASRAFTSFLMGHLLLEVAGLATAPGGAVDDPAAEDPAVRPLDGHPNLQRMAVELSRTPSSAEFDDALDSLLRRLELTLT